MSRDIRAVLFDLDGTLLDTLSDIARAMNTALAAHGLPTHPTDAYRQMVGSGAEVLVRRALRDDADGREASASDELVASLVSLMKREYAAHPVVQTRPYPGIPRVVAALAGLSIPLAVLSNKPDELVEPILAEFFARGTFSVVRGHAAGQPRKPDPAGAHAVAAALGMSPRQCLYLGDSDVDMHTARNANMLAVGAAWGFRGSTELIEAGAHRVINDPGELVPLVRSYYVHAEGDGIGKTY